jgi:hypothetical protein
MNRINSRTFLEYRTESNQIEFNRISSNLFDRTESNFFNISMFPKIVQKNQIHHVKSFKCNNTEFGSIEPNSNKHRKSSDPANPCLIRFGSVRLGSVQFGKREKF